MNRRISIEEGRTVLVTGGASGLGRQMALQAAGRGASVVIWDLDAAGGERVCDEIRANGGSAQSFVIDITDQNAVDKVAAQSGAVDVVINNAGLVTGEWFLDAPPQKIERLFQVNVLALYWVTRAFLGGMTERNRGCVVTIASAAGLVGVAQQTDYSASKFAALLPILDEVVVAGQILDSIERGRAMLVLPWFARTLPLVRLLPTRAFDRVADFFGINKTMEFFRGRSHKSR